MSAELRLDAIMDRIALLIVVSDEEALLNLWLRASRVERDESFGGESRWVARQVREHLEPMFLEVAA